MSDLSLKWTQNFEDNFKRYNGMRRKVVYKTADLIKRYESDPITWTYKLEKLKDESFGKLQVYRSKITDGDRLVFVIDDKLLILADIGRHSVMDDYSKIPRQAREIDVTNASDTPLWFQKSIAAALVESPSKDGDINLSDLLGTSIGTSEPRWIYDEELDSKWVQFLDESQNEIAIELSNKFSISSNQLEIHFLMGGPGTGKTVVLLNVAQRLLDQGRSVSLQLNDQVKKYLSSGGGIIPGLNYGCGPGVVVLVDDPRNVNEVAESIRKAKTEGARGLIFAFDPLQWHEPKMQIKFRKLCEGLDYQFSTLWICYRQSSRLAMKAIELTKKIFMEASIHSKDELFFEEKFEIEPYMDLTLGLEFVDSDGRYFVYKENIESYLSQECRRVVERIDLWSHSEALCLIYEDGLSKELRKSVKSHLLGVKRIDIKLSNVDSIRGVEFQEVFLFISHRTWRQIVEPTRGMQNEDWEKISQLHTILSRPKDSLVIFVI